MSTAVLHSAGTTSQRQTYLRPSIVHILEATSAGAARFVADVLLHHDTSRFDVTFVYSLLRSDERFLRDLEQIQDRGITAIEVPMARNIRPMDDLRAFAKLYSLFRGTRFDLVHCHSSKAGFLGRLASKLARKRAVTIYSPHAIAISVSPAYKPIEKLAGLFTDGILAVSKSEKEQLKNFDLVPPQKISYVTAAIDVASYAGFSRNNGVREKLGIPAEAMLIGTAGRVAYQKDPFTFLEVAGRILQEHPSAHFLWVGEGELREEVLSKVAASGLADRIHFPGYHAELRPLLATLDVFVLTSRYESFGYVTCEAMALGKPVVATHVAGSDELVRHGETGYLAEVGDIEDFSANLLHLVGDAQERRRMGAAGRLRAEQHFNLPRMVSEIEDLYENLLEERVA